MAPARRSWPPSTTIRTRRCASRRSRRSACSAAHRPRSPPAEASLFDPDARVRDAAIRTLGAVADDTALAAIPGLPDLARRPEPGRARRDGLPVRHRADRTPASERLIAELLEDPDERGARGWPRRRPSACATRPRSTPPAPLLGDPSPRVRVGGRRGIGGVPRPMPTRCRRSSAALDDDALRSDARRRPRSPAFETTPTGVVDVLLHWLAARPGGRARRPCAATARTSARTSSTGRSRRLERAPALRRARTVLAECGARRDDAGTGRRLALPVATSSPAASAASTGLALGALVVLGAPEAGGVIRRCLRSDDPEIRAQAIEALDSIGDRRLTGALVGLLEDEARRRRRIAMPSLAPAGR